MADTATKAEKAEAEEKEALRVDKQSVVFGGDATYITPDQSFTEGHGDPDSWPEEDLDKVKTVTTEGWVIEPKSREDRIAEREEEIKAAVAREKEIAEERAKEAEEEAERAAKVAETQQNLQAALAGLVSTASAPKSESQTKASSTSSKS